MQKAREGVWQNPWSYIACGFGLGLMPKAPGTFGTLLALPIYFIMLNCAWHTYAFITLGFAVFGFYLTQVVAKIFDNTDPKEVVWDEIVGYLITLFLVPACWYYILLGFVFFRFFDIYKPYPISLLNNIPNGFGIMADDILAGIFSCGLLHLIIWVI